MGVGAIDKPLTAEDSLVYIYKADPSSMLGVLEHIQSGLVLD